MKPVPRRILLFAVQFIPLFVLFLWIYGKVLPSYERVVVATGNVITERMSPPTRLDVMSKGIHHYKAWRILERGRKRHLRSWAPHLKHLMFLGLATLPALLLATPAPLRTRFRWLLLALPLLFITHVLATIGLTRGVQCLFSRPGTFVCLWMLRVVYTSGQVVGAALWALFTWRFWFPKPTAPVVD